MTWTKTPADRARDQAVYSDPEYIRNRAAARRRADGSCEQCRHKHARLQCDHIVNVRQGGGHDLANLRMLCAGNGTCKCHEAKTATEGGGYRKQADPAPVTRTNW